MRSLVGQGPGSQVQLQPNTDHDGACWHGLPWRRVTVTAGMMELAGMALSLFMCTRYVQSGAAMGRLLIDVFCDNEPIVGFAIEGGEDNAGARHLTPLVQQVQALRSDLMEDASVNLVRLARPDRGRASSGIRRADHLAGVGGQFH